MTERQLVTFLTLVETKSFTETANRLFLTQSAVSQQIKALERDINCTLFIRSKTGLNLTPSGQLFYQEAGSLVRHINSIYSKLRESDSGERIVRRLCYLPPLRILPQIIAKFSEAHPEVMLTITRADQLDMNSMMMFEQFDISVAFDEPQKDYRSLDFIPLFSCPMVCIIHQDHPLAQKKLIHVSDLHGQNVYAIGEHPHNETIHRMNTFFQNASDISFFPNLIGMYDATVMASSGQCICILPKIGILEDCPCVAVPLDIPVQFRIGLYISKDAPQDVRDFCEIASEQVKQDGGNVVVY